MPTNYWAQRITLGGAATIATITLIETISSLAGKRDGAHIAIVEQEGADQVLIYFPGLAMNATASSDDFLYLLDHTCIMLVDHPSSGYSREATFPLLAQQLVERGQGKKLIFLAVSMGSSVALDFRRYMNSRPDLKEAFPTANFIFLSPVITAADVKLGFRFVSGLGFIFRGGFISKYTVNQVLDSLVALSKIGKRLSNLEKKVQLLQSYLSVISVRLLASELRAVHAGHQGGVGEFPTDTAMILISDWDDIVDHKAPLKLIKAFGEAEIFEEPTVGHADIKQAVLSGAFAKAFARLN